MSGTSDLPRSVVITGASTGIGEACALELDRGGFRVFAGVRSEVAGEKLKAQASSRLTPVMIDVTDAASIAAAAEAVGRTLGDAGLAGLVNNAGIAVAGPLEAVPIEALRQQFEVNVIGQVAVTQVFLPLLRKARGRVVNISSINGGLSLPYMGAYSASKFAMEAVTDALRVELRTWGIRSLPSSRDRSIRRSGRNRWPPPTSCRRSIPPEFLSLYEADLAAVRARRWTESSARPRRSIAWFGRWSMP